MNWVLIAGLVFIGFLFGAWHLRTRNRHRNLWPTEGILEQIRMGQRSKDKYDEEVEFYRLAKGTDRGYTNAIKVFFFVGVALIVLSFFVGGVRAETVDVKYAGPINIDDYACVAVTRSSLVNRVCFNEGTSSMIVLLRDTYYAYCSVPPELVAEWHNAESMGRFYNQRIKSDAVAGLYACD